MGHAPRTCETGGSREGALTSMCNAFHAPRISAGYSGTAILSRQPPLSVSCGIGIDEHDGEVGWETCLACRLLVHMFAGLQGTQALMPMPHSPVCFLFPLMVLLASGAGADGRVSRLLRRELLRAQ